MIHSEELFIKDRLPDFLIRLGIRNRLSAVLEPYEVIDCEERRSHLMRHIESLRKQPIVPVKNGSRRELPKRFFERVLGRRMIYSAGYWDQGVMNLDESEERMLALVCERAELKDGQAILELGCGWGSLTLWMAENFPNSKITTIATSDAQCDHIESLLAAGGILNVEVKSCRICQYTGEGDDIFDRIVSIGQLEQVHNYELLMTKISHWLKPSGALFVHIFSHCEYAYHHEEKDSDDWMARYFLTGAQMPSDNLLLYFQNDLKIDDHWQISGRHYQKSFEAWLARMDAAREELLPLIAQTYGFENQTRWWVYWRVFFMACAEQWGYRDGEEWIVSHYRFRKNPHAAN